MKAMLKVVAATTVLTIAACSSGSDDAMTENEGAMTDNEASGDDMLPAMRTIETVEDFTATIVGKNMVLINDDGTRNPSSQVVVNADMTLTGFNENGGIELDWYWENNTYCRSGVSNLPDDSRTVELECQGVAVDGNVASFTRDGGAGELASSWFIEGVPNGQSKLAGDWRLTYEDECFETLTFNADNSLDIVELGEIQTGTYEVSAEVVGNGRHSLSTTILTDNQEPGCDGETESSAGMVFEFFIEFDGNVIHYYSSVDADNSILQLVRQ